MSRTATFRAPAAVRWHACLSLVFCATLLALPVHADGWPTVSVPKGLTTFDIGQQVSVNGLPMQLRGFVSARAARELADAFRHSLGKPLVEHMLGGKLVLGRREGEHYLSVQIESVANGGSRGIVAVTHLKAAYDNQAPTHDNMQRWLVRLPAGSRLLSQMESEDAGKLSRHLIISNSQDEALNRDHLVSLLAEEGLRLEREGAPDVQSAARMNDSLAASRLLFFKGADKEAIATLRRDGDGQTTVVLNIITSLERMR